MTASMSRWVRRGGATRAAEPWVSTSSSVREKYWGQVSQVMGAPRFFILRMMSTLPAVETWQMWTGAPVSSASMASRMTISSSAMEGLPSSHSWRDTAPSFTARPADMVNSSQWHRMGSSSLRARIRASRMRPALTMPRLSSDRATAPAFFRASLSVSSSPSRPRVTVPTGRTLAGQGAERVNISAIRSGLSSGGVVSPMQASVVTPPRTAAAVPEDRSSRSVWPGSRRWTCISIRPGATISPAASMVRSASADRPCSRMAIFPSSTSRS